MKPQSDAALYKISTSLVKDIKKSVAREADLLEQIELERAKRASFKEELSQAHRGLLRLPA